MRVIIVGAGFTGTQLALEILRRADVASRVSLIERSEQFGPGLAYSTVHAEHFLNVRAANMSAFEDDPSHFLRWLWASDLPQYPASSIPPTGHAFVARGIYGRYLAETLRQAEKEACLRVTLNRIPHQAVGLEETDEGVTARLANGTRIAADLAILATGNYPPQWPAADQMAALDARRMVADPWGDAILTRIGPDDPVIILGTGLTMVDLVALLKARGHRAPIRAISRRGLVPQMHEHTRKWEAFLRPHQGPATAATYIRRVRAEIETAAAANVGWHSVIDALRPFTQDLWRQLPETERRRFLRHVRPFWEVHRHRMAPPVAALVNHLRAVGALTIEAGRIVGWAPSDTGIAVDIRPKGRADRIVRRKAAYVVNCSGASLDYRHIRDPLVRALLDVGLARPDTLGLGLAVTGDLALVRADGRTSRRIYALGPPTKGELWEITAVPDIRKQTRAFAERLIGPVRNTDTLARTVAIGSH